MRVALSMLVSLALVLSLAGCGDTGGDSASGAGGSAATGGSYVDWPLFGRVPERTHYLPAEEKALDPPLREAWSVNTHALIEFPPAIHDGVAYVINKYGNGKAVRLRDRKVLWELNVRPSDRGKPNFVTAPVYYDGVIYGAFLSGNLVAGDAKTGKKLWVRKLGGHLESSPLAVDGRLYLGTDSAKLLARRCQRQDALELQRAGGDQIQPQLRRRQGLLRRLPEQHVRPRREERQAGLAQ
jgi:outer membrane protein assembly factor BamB